eukprot:CAMPEP_0169479726 /NCGR_PEP_ID=MMETSP1042-20121227/29172_1 /TAXON_ID=464988 /ORGANISM="Hemiselmis andersenii, Strain CCMP1180" /LENGTH=82 /DNA_ID=CAMNT_0009594299 /DNA_START=141 /DNA_END=386 /DNA_ORIENTATION=-
MRKNDGGGGEDEWRRMPAGGGGGSVQWDSGVFGAEGSGYGAARDDALTHVEPCTMLDFMVEEGRWREVKTAVQIATQPFAHG